MTLTRRAPLKRKPSKMSPRLREAQARLRWYWHQRTRGQRCALCGAIDPREVGAGEHTNVAVVRGHHVIRKQHISAARGFKVDLETIRLLWDLRNHLAVCDGCHGAHHHAGLRISRKVLDKRCPNLLAFIDEVGIDARRAYDRDYPA